MIRPSAEFGSRRSARAMAVAWAQWSALTTMAVPAGPRARAMVDPEALVLLSLAVRGRERRLDDLVLGGCAPRRRC